MTYPTEIEYSQKFMDANFCYRLVHLTEVEFKRLFPTVQSRQRLLEQREWLGGAIKLSELYQHCMLSWEREPHVLVFRRPIYDNDK